MIASVLELLPRPLHCWPHRNPEWLELHSGGHTYVLVPRGWECTTVCDCYAVTVISRWKWLGYTRAGIGAAIYRFLGYDAIPRWLVWG